MFNLTLFLVKFIKIDQIRRNRIIVWQERCGLNANPERLYAEAIVKSFYVLLMIPAVCFFKLYFIIIFIAMLATAVFFKHIDSLKSRIDIKNNNILNDLPSFVRTFSNNLEINRDIIGIIERYRFSACSDFQDELDILLINLKSGNHQAALRKFDERLMLEPVTAFVSGLIGVSNGVDFKVFFYLMENNMKILARENLRREALSRPKKIKKAMIAIIIAETILFVFPIIVQLTDSLSLFG